MTVHVEAAVDSFAGALAAQEAGVHRIELCGPCTTAARRPVPG